MKQRVFVVEDLRRMRELLIDLFSSRGAYQVVGTACTEAEAMAWLDEHGDGWDIAIIDLVLDEGTGLGVLRRAREHTGGLVAVLAGCVTDNLREHCYALGADKIFEESDTGRFVLWLDRMGTDEPWTSRPAPLAPLAGTQRAAPEARV
jgi:DNA-binding response OmpR family regulator